MTVTMNNGSENAVAAVKLPMDKLVDHINIAELLSKEQLTVIGREAVEGYNQDRSTRSGWEQRMETAIKLTLQVVEDKSFPWVNCSNVKFPLVTVAALQFLSRVSILTKGRQMVKCEVIGPDPSGTELARSKRISGHMSCQLVEEDKNWINDDEKAKFSASIIGCAFKKSRFDSVEGINISEHVPAARLVVDYHTKSFEKSNRVTHILDLTANDIQERVRRGVFLEMDSDKSVAPTTNLLQTTSDTTQGLQKPADSSISTFEVLEQHCFLDLDGDGYREPYIVFVKSDDCQVLRIVARYFDTGDVHRVNDKAVRRMHNNAATTSNADAKKEYLLAADKLQRDSKNFVVRIDPQQFFTKYTFIPSIDGGFYELGLGALLGPINESVNTIINQQIDAGTMQVTAGGFLGRGVKIKGGKLSFDPFEWKVCDSTGDDLRKNIMPLPVNAPSEVLFNLLGILIGYGEKIGGATDIMTGVSPGQNTPAETSRNTVEQGMKIFSGIYGRMHRAFKEELEKLFKLNRLYLEDSPRFIPLTSGEGAMIALNDYSKDFFRVSPAADVQVVSESQRQQKAMMVVQAADHSPLYNQYLAHKEMLEAFDVQGIDQLLPDPKGPNALPPRPNPKFEIEKQKLELEKQNMEMGWRQVAFELEDQMRVNEAKINELNAKAEKLLAEANGVDIGHQIAIINAQTGAAKVHQEGMGKALELMHKQIEFHHKNNEQSLKQQELSQQKQEPASSAAPAA